MSEYIKTVVPSNFTFAVNLLNIPFETVKQHFKHVQIVPHPMNAPISVHKSYLTSHCIASVSFV